MTLKNKVKFGSLLILVLSIIIFIMQNSLQLEVNFLFFNLINVSLIKLVLTFLFVGILLGMYITHSFINWRVKKKAPKDELELEIDRAYEAEGEKF